MLMKLTTCLYALLGSAQVKELFKKVWQKVAIGKFATFLTPFQASSTKICLQVSSEIRPLNSQLLWVII